MDSGQSTMALTANGNSSSSGRRIDWLALWILFSAWCCFSGWILSLAGWLNRSGYAAAFVLFVGGIILGRRYLLRPGRGPARHVWRYVHSRLLLPKLWLALVLMVLGGGLIYHPDNFDYLTYRFPRLLHWAWDHHWSWIHSPDLRLNISSIGIEWIMLPIFVFFKTDRLFFLINLVSYLLLPGLVFSVFRNLGISGRVCWWWMWILPVGFCYVLQAGGMANDMFAAVYFLASLHYLFQAREEGNSRGLVLSFLSLALLTGAKVSNVPLAAVWFAVVLVNWKAIWEACQPGVLFAAALVSAVISFLPVAAINIYFTGSYTGDLANIAKLQATSPLAGIIGNSLEIGVANLSPPLWTHKINWHLIPSSLEGYFQNNFPRLDIKTVPFQIEETAGLGLGPTVFVLLGFFYGLSARLGRPGWQRRVAPGALWVAAATAVACLGFMSKMGGEDGPRLFTVYYIPVIAALLAIVPLDGSVVHRWPWKVVGYAAMAMVFPIVALNPSRPLIPVNLTLQGLRIAGVPTAVVTTLGGNYHIRASRFDCYRELLQDVPAGETAIGAIIGNDDPEVSLWLPFGSREVVYLDPFRTTSSDLKVRGVHYIVVSDLMLQRYHLTVEGLSDEWTMTTVKQSDLAFLTDKVSTWYLLRVAP